MSQTLDVYPSPNIPTQTSSHSKGSFAPVLIVLAVIFVLVIISLVLGRICNRRYHNSKVAERSHGRGSHKKAKKAKQNDMLHHQSAGEGDIDIDIEFGFDKRFASSKVAANVDHFKGPSKMPPHGEHKGPVRFADDDHIEFRGFN
ncbi:hypothetical protein ACH5RR_035633 [Cinchona calisaya]|uniref:Transmembrane protein n=1 Tax=Cinchona calisaya TaxID=153742 RepID=A0ABD2Y5T3_9GENT